MISKTLVLKLIEDRIAELSNGLFIVDIHISATNVIYVELDKYEGNVALSDCMAVSRNVEHNLNREQEDFELNVSSAGLDKPLRVLPQYIKNIGRQVKVLMNDDSKLQGVLIAADENKLILEQERKEKIEGKKKKELIVEQSELLLNQIKETKIVITFK